MSRSLKKQCGLLLPLLVQVLWAGIAFAAEYTFSTAVRTGDSIDGRYFVGFDSQTGSLELNRQRTLAFFGNVADQPHDAAGILSVLTQDRVVVSSGIDSLGRMLSLDTEDQDGLAINSRGDVANVVHVIGDASPTRAIVVNGTAVFDEASLVDGLLPTILGGDGEIGLTDDGVVVAIVEFGSEPADREHSLVGNGRIVAQQGDVIDGTTVDTNFELPLKNLARNGTPFTPETVAQVQERLRDVSELDLPELSSVTGYSINQEMNIAFLGIEQLTSTTHRRYIFDLEEFVVAEGDVVDGEIIRQLAVRPTIEEDGRILYLARTDSGLGVFADKRKIFSEGDVVGGANVSAILGFASNGYGDVAVQVDFADGTSGIVVGAVPEPSSMIYVPVLVWLVFRGRKCHPAG